MDHPSLHLSSGALKAATETRRTSNFYFEDEEIKVNVTRATAPSTKKRLLENEDKLIKWTAISL